MIKYVIGEEIKITGKITEIRIGEKETKYRIDFEKADMFTNYIIIKEDDIK